MATADIRQTQQELIDKFTLLGDWMERYQYIIDMGKKLPALPEAYQTEDYRLHGCQSQVWVVADYDGERLHFQAVSDAAIVSGLIAMVLKVYSGRTPQEILDTPPEFIHEIGLSEHLSPTRSNGLDALMKRIKAAAAAAVAGQDPNAPAVTGAH